MQPIDDGYFPRGTSVLRRVHGSRAVGVLYGQRALLMQATHPVAFAGLMANTKGLDAPFQRLARTARTMERVFFGSRTEAEAVTAHVRGMHARVRGTLDRPAGPHPAGSAYSAEAPDLLLWILACLADSSLAVYEQLVRRLDGDERERFWSDYLVLGELFGLDPADAPADYSEMRAYMEGRLASDELHVVEPAHEIGRKVAFEMPLPPHREPALRFINFLVVGLVPARVRALYDIPWDPARQAAFEALSRSLRLSARITPASLRRGPSAREYEVVARAERERLRRAA
ncbi:MAG: oxygenase MpaB family protein [Thermoleophilaceae bacterium]